MPVGQVLGRERVRDRGRLVLVAAGHLDVKHPGLVDARSRSRSGATRSECWPGGAPAPLLPLATGCDSITLIRRRHHHLAGLDDDAAAGQLHGQRLDQAPGAGGVLGDWLKASASPAATPSTVMVVMTSHSRHQNLRREAAEDLSNRLPWFSSRGNPLVGHKTAQLA